MDDRKLKEYALNIFNNVPGYSLQKAFALFPMYYTKIAFYYSELITQKQEELTTRTSQSVGITRAQNLVRFAREANFTIKKVYFSSSVLMQKLDEIVRLMEFNTNYEEYSNYKIDVFKTHGRIMDNVKFMASLNNKAFTKVKDEANKYGFNDILKEANYYLAMNNALLRQIVKVSNSYIESYIEGLNIN